MGKVNYELKAHLLKLSYLGRPLLSWVKKICMSINLPFSPYAMSVDKAMQLSDEIAQLYGEEVIVELQKIAHSEFERYLRLRKRIELMIVNSPCLFLTLTFRDDFLNSTKEDYRRQCIRRFLKQFNAPYIANIDFGNKDEYVDENGEIHTGTHREHYHALIGVERIDHTLYKYGNIDFERVRKTTDNVKLAKYISKLTNHAIKETTKRTAIIYSKGFVNANG